VTPYYPWHALCPFALLLTFDYFLDCLKNQGISSLNCSVGQRVIYICKGDLHPNLFTEILEHGTIEILSVVYSDLLRDSVVTDDVLPENFWIVAEVMLVTGCASTHLVKYPTTMMAKV
jgi:hypothetical protein